MIKLWFNRIKLKNKKLNVVRLNNEKLLSAFGHSLLFVIVVEVKVTIISACIIKSKSFLNIYIFIGYLFIVSS